MTEERKKISLQDAIKQKLAAQKQQQTGKGAVNQPPQQTKALKSQNTKKPNNQRRRTGV